MRRPLRLENTVQRYAWGSREAIPDLIGAARDGQPWAELWLGAHPSAPSRAAGGMPLDQLIAAGSDELLGDRVTAAFGARLPFLFKILAAARPLSIQCHPDPDQARAGFARENQRGVPLAARERNYKDDSHKPELIAALGRFEALVGFREPAVIRGALARIVPRSLAAELDLLDAAGGLGAFFAALMRLAPDRRRALVSEAAAALAGDPSREADWTRRLAGDFPADPGVLAPFLLHRVELAADQALFLGPGLLHAYLEGTGLEIMASSDNVLRGGLTDKHVDVAELCAVLRFEPHVPTVIRPESADGRLHEYRTPAREFRLSFIDLAAGAYTLAAPGPAIALCLGARCRIQVAGDRGLELTRGQSAFLPAAVAAVHLDGDGRLYLASVPDCDKLPRPIGEPAGIRTP